jgi:hypothetical protein
MQHRVSHMSVVFVFAERKPAIDPSDPPDHNRKILSGASGSIAWIVLDGDASQQRVETVRQQEHEIALVRQRLESHYDDVNVSSALEGIYEPAKPDRGRYTLLFVTRKTNAIDRMWSAVNAHRSLRSTYSRSRSHLRTRNRITCSTHPRRPALSRAQSPR